MAKIRKDLVSSGLKLERELWEEMTAFCATSFPPIGHTAFMTSAIRKLLADLKAEKAQREKGKK